MKKTLLLFLACSIAMISCKNKPSEKSEHPEYSEISEYSDSTNSIRYAQGFKVERHDGWLSLEISDPQSSNHADTYRFALVSSDDAKTPSGMPRIKVPVKNVVCTTTLQLSGFLKLQALNYISGIMSAKRLFSPMLKQYIDEGKIVKVGKEGDFDVELILASQPSAILVSLSKRGGFDKLEDLGFPLIPYMGYQETSPLAQAEWIKFVGLLTGQAQEADSLFNAIEQSYLSARDTIQSYLQTHTAETPSSKEATTNRPNVLYGKLHGDNWYAMGGESFISKICKDAGARYFMVDDNRTGGVNLDFENIYAMANNVDFWIIQNKSHTALTYQSLLEEDERYADFRPWKEHHIVCCDMSQTPINELSPMEPDTILLDFIHAFHPGFMNDYHPKYYQIISR